MREIEQSRVVGSWRDAPIKSKAAKATHRLFIDGVVDSQRLSALELLPSYVHHLQMDNFCLVGLSRYHDGMKLREILDPHKFVLLTSPALS